MKISITYTQDDIVRLIEQDLAASGLSRGSATLECEGSVVLTLEVERLPWRGPVVATPETRDGATSSDVSLGPPLETVDRVTLGAGRGGRPAARSLMPGESLTWPGLDDKKDL